ncbi:hypothetical protein ACFQ2H_16695 [Streptomyces violaceoruber]
MTRTESATPPADYRLLLPEGWFRILLDPDQRDDSIDALVERQFRGIDNAPHLKEELRGDLRRRAAKAYRGGGIELYLSLQAAGPLTIPASLLVTLAPLRHAEPLPPEDLARVLAEDAEATEAGSGNAGTPVPEIAVEELTAGTAVRVRRLTRQPGENGPDAPMQPMPPSRSNTTSPSPARRRTCCSPSPHPWSRSPTRWPASSTRSPAR